jgi:hypothetical protein
VGYDMRLLICIVLVPIFILLNGAAMLWLLDRPSETEPDYGEKNTGSHSP